MKILILHDFLAVKGGAEHVALYLLNSLGNQHEVTLVTGYINEELYPELKHRDNIISLSKTANIKGWESLKISWLFKHKVNFLKEYDVCVFSGIYCLTATLKSTPKRAIYYCHTPPRFVYDLKEHYKNQASYWQRLLLMLLRNIVKKQYEKSIANMDTILANSKNVQKRLKKYLFIGSSVLYPPVNTHYYKWIDQSNYYLSTARLEAYKQVELVIRAFMHMPEHQLVVTSSGHQYASLKALAKNHSNITFTGWTRRSQLAKLVGNCIATIYIPIDEDFGISPVESMAAGKPVIGINEGGVIETIVPNVTGALIPAPVTIGSIISTVNKFSSLHSRAMRTACEERALLYSTGTFEAAFNKVLIT